MIIQLVLLGLLLYILPSFLQFVSTLRYKKKLSSKIPGDEGAFILGHIPEFGMDPEVMPHRGLAKAAREVKEGRQLMKLWFLQDNIYMPLNGQNLKHILDSNEEIVKGEEYDVFLPWLGTGLLLSTGSKWRLRRKMLTPTFHFSMLDGYVSTMNRHSKICVDLLEDYAGTEVDMYPIVKMCALDIICETAMGKELNSQRNPHQPYVDAIVNLMILGTHITMKFYLQSALGRKLTGIQQEFDRNLIIAHDFTKRVIAERAEQLANGEVEPNKRAFLDLLLAKKEELDLTDEDIREETDTFMFEGHDTTSSGLGWSVWCLASHPEIQQKVYEEIRSVFGDDTDMECGREEMSKLQYLDRFVKESMRLYPPVPFVSRQLQSELVMEGHVLPEGCNISIAPFIVHRNESIYPNALEFNPDNFLPEKVAARHAYDYIPFSAGPRNCIGQKFAQYEEKIILSWLLRRYRFSTDKSFSDQPFASEAILRPVEGIKVTVHRR